MERLKGMLFGAFVGDAYALSFNGVYDKEKFTQTADKLDHYLSPNKDSYNYGKRKGDFTHVGDQSLLLLKSIASESGFSIDAFKLHWLTYMRKYEGYIDSATKESLNILDNGTKKGSSSDDLSGIARVAPLIFYHFDDPDLSKSIELQTRLTHNSDFLCQIGFFIQDLLLELIIGKPFNQTLDVITFKYPEIGIIISKLNKRLTEDTFTVVKDIGQSASSQFSFPAALYLLLKYKDDFQEAMKQNLLCGGDSASRGMVIGMILGATFGFSNLPTQWVKELNEYALINSFTQRKLI